MRIGSVVTAFAMLAGMTLSSGGAHATLTYFNDRSLWEATLGGSIVTEDFNAVTPFTLGARNNAAGLLDITLINVLGATNRIGDISEFWNIDGTTGFLGGVNATGAEEIFVNLPEAVFGWGADFSTTHSGGGLTLEIDSILAEFSHVLPDLDLFPETEGGTGFLGVISTNAFSSIRLFDESQNETFGMDNVSFGIESVSIHEPAALIIFGTGFLGIAVRWRRRNGRAGAA